MRNWTDEEWPIFCQQAAEAWNGFARRAGWPERLEQEELLKKRRFKTNSAKAWGESSFPPKDGITWVLSRWNWDRSPAPIELLCSRNQWDAWRALQTAIQEEIHQRRELCLKHRREEARSLINRLRRSGITQEERSKQALEIIRASGKWRAWSIQEKMAFYEELEDQNDTIDKNEDK